MKTCPHCAESDLQDDAKICKHCGKKLKKGWGCAKDIFMLGVVVYQFELGQIVIAKLIKFATWQSRSDRATQIS